MRAFWSVLLVCGCGADRVTPSDLAGVDLAGTSDLSSNSTGESDLSDSSDLSGVLRSRDDAAERSGVCRRRAASGVTGVWTQLDLPMHADGDWCQSIVVDPVNPGTLITACGNNDGRKIKWYRTSDFGTTWALVNSTDMNGNPWGFSIDPNPARDPQTPPTLYAPAGYGSNGAWKSTDGASSWTRLAGADTAFADYNPFGGTDLYHVAILPDDPPNHVLATYHYYFKNNTEGGFGETWDGGRSWVVHPPPPGVGTSHYVLPISATTWCVIAQSNSGTNGVWRTTTAGRTGGTAAQKFRDGTISTAAWTKVSDHEHFHGSYTPVKIGSSWYSPGLNASEGSIGSRATTAPRGRTWCRATTGPRRRTRSS